VIRDKRRIDPQTGALRPDIGAGIVDPVGGTAPPAAAPPAPEPAANDAVDELVAQLAERTADLQRLQAEYVNYRRRVERDREVVRDVALIGTLTELLPILDDIGRARAHEELVGGFKVVAESLEATVAKLGLAPYGDDGDPFDPHLHEAIMHEFSSAVSAPTCVAVFAPGYRVGERVVRPARVKVAEPEPVDPSGGAVSED
jgi:molecular chaperone GrpE